MRRGFSIGESVLAAFIVCLVVLALFNLFPSSAMAVRRAEMQIRADAISQRLLESYREKGFVALNLGLVAPPPNPEEHEGVTYTPQVEIFQVTGSNVSVIKGIRSTVAWRFRQQTYQTVHESWLTRVYSP